jgi:hypothetical protein
MIMKNHFVPVSAALPIALSLLPLLGIPLTAQAQDAPPPTAAQERVVLTPPAPKRSFGFQLGTYIPNNQAVKNKFGASWTGVGLGIGPIYAPQLTRKTNFDFTVLSTKRKFTSATLIPIGFSYRQSLQKVNIEEIEKGNWPHSGSYFGGSANIIAGQLRSNLVGDNFGNSWKTTSGGSFYVGHVFSEKFSVEARYFALGKLQGFDFSGLSLSAGLRF